MEGKDRSRIAVLRRRHGPAGTCDDRPVWGPDSDFAEAVVDTPETRIFVRHGGAGPPLLLLHGFPQTHLMWRDVAPLLARDFTVVCADLRGYGRSGCPLSNADTSPTRSGRSPGTWSR